MHKTLQRLGWMKNLNVIYVANFILSFHLFLVIYANSSFLAQFVEERFVGTLFIIGSVLTVAAFLILSGALRKIGNFALLLIFSVLQFFFFLIFAFSDNAQIILPTFIAYIVTYPLILYTIDIFIESYTKDEGSTGVIRGTLLTTTNVALILAPLVAGFVLNQGSFGTLYLLSGLFIIPFVLLMLRFRRFKDPVYKKLEIKNTFLCIMGDKDLFGIFMSQFLMRFFFSWMVIYMPIYLTQHLGFSWAEFGIMTFIFLLPFAILEYPVGKIADTRLGEKEFLISGFLITSLFVLFIPLVNTTSFAFWASLLFFVRVGASLIEITTESYFFKHVDGSDSGTISFFRMTRPVAYILGPLVGTITLYFLDFQYIWFVLGIIFLSGIWFASKIRDTL